MIDELTKDDVPTLDELMRWIESSCSGAAHVSDPHPYYLSMHPKIQHIKNTPFNSVVLDVGAGSGGLRGMRDWILFTCRDLKFIGLSLEHGEQTENYEEFYIGDVEEKKPTFSHLKPTHAVLAHFIEHMRDPGAILTWLASNLPRGGQILIEWPSWHSQFLPSMSDIRARGYPVVTINFFDDRTHVKPLAISTVCKLLTESGFRVRAAGFVDMPYIAESLMNVGVSEQSTYFMTIALWLRTRFSSYVVADRV